MRAMTSSRSDARSVSTRMRDVSTAMRPRVASTTTPVSPIPPAVAQNKAGSRSGPTVTWPEGVARTRALTWRQKPPSTWWFLPWMSAATAPPTVTWRVPGVTGRNQPRGKSRRISSSRVTPPPARTSPPAVYEQRVPQDGDDEGHDRQLEPDGRVARPLRLFEGPQAVGRHRHPGGDRPHGAEVGQGVVSQGTAVSGAIPVEVQVFGLALARHHEQRAEGGHDQEPVGKGHVGGHAPGDGPDDEA